MTFRAISVGVQCQSRTNVTRKHQMEPTQLQNLQLAHNIIWSGYLGWIGNFVVKIKVKIWLNLIANLQKLGWKLRLYWTGCPIAEIEVGLLKLSTQIQLNLISGWYIQLKTDQSYVHFGQPPSKLLVRFGWILVSQHYLSTYLLRKANCQNLSIIQFWQNS